MADPLPTDLPALLARALGPDTATKRFAAIAAPAGHANCCRDDIGSTTVYRCGCGLRFRSSAGQDGRAKLAAHHRLVATLTAGVGA